MRKRHFRPSPGKDPNGPENSQLRTTIRFAWAVLLSLSFGLALQYWIVHFLGTIGPKALYVQSIYIPIGFLVIAVTEGLSVVTQVTAGIATRTRDRAHAARLVPTFVLTAGCLLLVVGLGFRVLATPILDLLAVPRADRTTVVAFTLSTIAASAGGLVPVAAGAAVRGIGSVRIASVLGVLGSVVSAVCIWAVNTVFHLGIYSVPVGGLIATLLGGSGTIAALWRAGVRTPRMSAEREGLRAMWTIAAPVAATNLLLSTVGWAICGFCVTLPPRRSRASASGRPRPSRSR